MSWKNLLIKKDEKIITPWIGGRALTLGPRRWRLEGRLPEEHGWYRFLVTARKAHALEPTERPDGILKQLVTGYLVGDHLASDSTSAVIEIQRLIEQTERVFLLEDGLGKFSRIMAGRVSEDGPLFYAGLAMPLGPENDVICAYEDRLSSVDNISGVTPAMDAAFRLEVFQRAETERRRIEIERQRQEEQEKFEREAQRQELIQKIGNAHTRRELAVKDFSKAAHAALGLSEAEYLDHYNINHREVAVRFRMLGRRFQCTCDKHTFQIIDAGICLTNHHTRERGDTQLTLESLPSVIREANRTGQLVVTIHPGGHHNEDDLDED
jgi:hypothetical protein